MAVPPEKLTTAAPVALIAEETVKVAPLKSSEPAEATWTVLLEEIVPPPWSESVPDETERLAEPMSLKVLPGQVALEPEVPPLGR